jgi:CheY-like chemotaxis protein
LVVEDDATFAERLVELIEARDLKAMVASSGQEALELARIGRPRGILLDVRLPDMDGWVVMERLQNDPSTRAIPVHFISGVDAPERAFSLGAIGYLRKPASREELIQAIQAVARLPAAVESARVLVVEDDAAQGTSLVELLRSGSVEASCVRTAAAAFDKLIHSPFGCVVLDLGLPDMDGLELLETLQTRGDVVMPPVVVHTGRSLTREETRRIEAYAQAIVLKDGTSAERLLDEVKLFLQHVKKGSLKDRATDALLPGISLTGSKILVADDDMRTVYAVSALLRGKGAEVIVAENGQEALARMTSHPDVAAILMDVMMPEMDGYEALKRLRRDARFARIPAIALTAKAMKEERQRCLDAGATEYLAKPVDPARLLELLKDLLSGAAP